MAKISNPLNPIASLMLHITSLKHLMIVNGATLFQDNMDYADLKRTKSFSTVSNIILRSSSLSWISILLICSD